MAIINYRNILYTIIYSILYIICYLEFLNPNFDYAGFEINHFSYFTINLSIIIILIPCLFIRSDLKLSTIISIFIYVLIYIPTIISFELMLKVGLMHVLTIQITFAVCMVLLFLSDRIVLSIPKLSVNVPFKIILFIIILFSVYLLFKYRSNLQLVSFDKVYELRKDNNKLGDDLITRYLSSWLFNVFIPIALAYSLINRNKIYFIIGTLSCVVIYAATAAKSAILLPIIYIAIYYGLRKNYNKLLSVFLKYLSISMLIILYIGFNIFSSIILSRTIGNGGKLMYWYYDFFSNHQYTYYNHVNMVNLIFNNYPYGNLDVGQVIGQNYWGDDNSNANFWATDGIAGLGIYGVYIITIVLFAYFILINNITKNANQIFVLMCFLPFILYLTNGSFFSSMLTGGGGILTMFFYLINFRNTKDENINVV